MVAGGESQIKVSLDEILFRSTIEFSQAQG